MNQFHTPSFGDEVFELNDTPTMEPQNETASRRMLSLDHNSSLNDDDEEDPIDYDAAANHLDTYGILNQQQLMSQAPRVTPIIPTPPHLQQPQSNVAPAKPLAPFALFFRDTVTAIKHENPTCSLEEISAIVNTMWDALDETQKNVYTQRHELGKRDYIRQMRDYRHQVSETEQPSVLVNNSQQETPSITNEQQPYVADEAAAPPQQIQLLTEAAAVQKCTREQCNKPAIINPDWEDEYCSNECVVIHCRNVFNEWARSLKNSPT